MKIYIHAHCKGTYTHVNCENIHACPLVPRLAFEQPACRNLTSFKAGGTLIYSLPVNTAMQIVAMGPSTVVQCTVHAYSEEEKDVDVRACR